MPKINRLQTGFFTSLQSAPVEEILRNVTVSCRGGGRVVFEPARRLPAAERLNRPGD